jgi:hypothetical protein
MEVNLDKHVFHVLSNRDSMINFNNDYVHLLMLEFIQTANSFLL